MCASHVNRVHCAVTLVLRTSRPTVIITCQLLALSLGTCLTKSGPTVTITWQSRALSCDTCSRTRSRPCAHHVLIACTVAWHTPERKRSDLCANDVILAHGSVRWHADPDAKVSDGVLAVSAPRGKTSRMRFRLCQAEAQEVLRHLTWN